MSEQDTKGGKIFGLSLALLFGAGSLLFFLPAIALLVLHFVIGLSIWWFIGVCIAWMVYWIVLYLLVLLGRLGISKDEEDRTKNPNVNPYSKKGNPYKR